MIKQMMGFFEDRAYGYPVSPRWRRRLSTHKEGS